MTLRTEFHHLAPTLTYTLSTEAETAALAQTLSRYVLGGDVIKLEGDLGAGKTTFTQYLLQALGHTGDIPSPTYTLVQEYASTRLPVAHLDAYRLDDPSELEALGLRDYLRHGLTIVEWPSKTGDFYAAPQEWITYHLQSILNPGTLTIALQTGANPTSRTVTLTGSLSWQRRFALFNSSVPRPSTNEGRAAFLATTDWAGGTIESLGADWSLRSYWRVRKDGKTCFLMDSPPPQEGTQAYVEVANYYLSLGLRAPQIYAQNEAEGYLLIEEFVGEVLLDKIIRSDADVPAWYEAAADALVVLCNDTPPASFRRLTPADLLTECKSMMDYGLPLALGRAATIAERQQYEQRFTPLFKRLFALPQGHLIWDYQSPNLICMPAPINNAPSLQTLGIIDIQDARVAPFAQDAGLLVRDLRRHRIDALEEVTVTRLAKGLNLPEAEVRWAISVGSLLQQIRINGNLCRMVVRDQKSAGAKRFLPRSWEIIRQTAAEAETLCPEAKPLLDFLLPLEQPMLAKVSSL